MLFVPPNHRCRSTAGISYRLQKKAFPVPHVQVQIVSTDCTNSNQILSYRSSVLSHSWFGDRKGIWPVKSRVLVFGWWWSNWSFARLRVPLRHHLHHSCSIKIQYGLYRRTQPDLEYRPLSDEEGSITITCQLSLGRQRWVLFCHKNFDKCHLGFYVRRCSINQ